MALNEARQRAEEMAQFYFKLHSSKSKSLTDKRVTDLASALLKVMIRIAYPHLAPVAVVEAYLEDASIGGTLKGAARYTVDMAEEDVR